MGNKYSIQTNHGKIYYWKVDEADTKDCIIFTHGMTMDHIMFTQQVDFFKDHFITIVWDVPLHGESRPYTNFSLKHAAEGLKAIMEQENIEKAHMAGQSMGGYILQEFAVQAPQMLASLTFVDSSPFGEIYYSKLDRWILSHVDLFSNWYSYNMLVKSIANTNTSTAYANQSARKALENLSKEEIIYLMDKVYKELILQKEQIHFDVPTMLVYGENDKTGKVIEYNKKWAENEGYCIQKIPNAAHNSNVDNAPEFNRILFAFLNSISDPFGH